MRLLQLCALLSCGLAALPAQALVPKSEPIRQDAVERAIPRVLPRHESVVDGDPKIDAFLRDFGGEWSVTKDPRTARVSRAQGSGIALIPGRGNNLQREAVAPFLQDGRPTVEGLAPLVRAFVSRNAALLEPTVGKLELDAAKSSVREKGRLASFSFRWTFGGLPVEGAEVYVRLNSGNITQFGAPLIGNIVLDTDPTLSADEAVRRAMAHSGDLDAHRLSGEPELWIQPEDGGAILTHRLVWKITYTVPGNIETWEARIDAHSGAVIGFRDTNFYGRAVGGVYPRTVLDDNEITLPMPQTDVLVGGASVTTDNSGAFGYTGEGLSAGLNGRWFNTNCQGCNTPEQPTVQADVGLGWVDFGQGGQDRDGNGFSTPADRNTFYHLNQIRRIAKKWLPGLGWLDSTITSIVNINSVCNAVYNGNVNFYASGGGCNNTGEVSDVVHHEWGHGIDGNTRGGGGGTGEGTADVAAIQMSHSPLIGPGFRTNGSPVRNVDSAVSGLVTFSNNSQVCGGGSHCQGQAFGQSAWELAQSLVAKHGQHTGWRVSERLFFTSLPDQGDIDPADAFSIYDAYIMADDDDGNLVNGTPNAQEIFDAFDPHELANAALPTSPACTRPAQPVVNVTPQCGQFDIGWTDVPAASGYQLFRAEVRLDSALYHVSDLPAGSTSYIDSEVAPGVDYWYVVLAADATGCESTIENPVFARLPAQPVLTLTAATPDDIPRGNRSGFSDPGEDVDVLLTLGNFGEIDATAVSGTLSSSTPGVSILEAVSNWSLLPKGSSAVNPAALRFTTDDQVVACGDVVQFEFVPAEASGCATETSHFSVRIGEPDGGGGFVCDLTPACFIEPTFDGLQSAAGSSSCGEVDLAWNTASTNCTNATISYNVYRSTDPGFAPGPANLVAAGLASTALTDILLAPGQAYHYVVRAADTRSGEDANLLVQTVVSPVTPDIRAPLFDGLEAALSGTECGETVLNWTAALESCNAPVAYEVYRSTDPAFVPGPATLIGSTLDTSFGDAALAFGADYTYIVRARDGVGNEDVNQIRATLAAGETDLLIVRVEFESYDGDWKRVPPDDADTGNWEWGDPEATSFQTGECATGTNCWVTGLSGTPSNGDIDNGTTTLLSKRYDLTGRVDPAVHYWRYFTNDRGAAPGEAGDVFDVEISDDAGSNWTALEQVGAGTPLDWVEVVLPVPPGVNLNNFMKLRFTARDVGSGSLVEAGVDDFELVDLGQGCLQCSGSVDEVAEITVNRVGDDIVVDWTDDPAVGSRFIVHKVITALEGPDVVVSIASTPGRTFVHQNAALSSESYYYRVSAVDGCGNPGPWEPPLP